MIIAVGFAYWGLFAIFGGIAIGMFTKTPSDKAISQYLP